MSRVAVVLSFDRVASDSEGHGVDVKADPGGAAPVTVPHFADPGDDSCPLPGDFVALESSSGAGAEHATGYADVQNAGKALAGEKRIYARDGAGGVVVELWLKGDGSIVLSNQAGSFELAPNGDVTISGSLHAKGEVTAKAGTPQQVTVTQHLHGTGVGPTTAPTPGT